MSFSDTFKIDLGASEFDFENNTKNGTLSEERNDKQKADAAEIIKASAGGLDSITNFASLFTGTSPNNQQQTYTPPPPEPKKTNPLVLGGIAVGVLLLIMLLIKTNGKPTASK